MKSPLADAKFEVKSNTLELGKPSNRNYIAPRADLSTTRETHAPSPDVIRFENVMSPPGRRSGRHTPSETSPQQPQEVQAGNGTSGKTPLLLIGERQHRLYPLDPQKIDYIEADHNYVTFWVGTTEYISRDSIKRLSTILSDAGFVRIERSVLVNIRAIAYAQMAGRRAFGFTLTSGVCLHSSASFRDAILRVLPLAPSPKR